jgi:hypothetical protein
MFFLQVPPGSPSSSGPVLSIYEKHPQSFFWGFSFAYYWCCLWKMNKKLVHSCFSKDLFMADETLTHYASDYVYGYVNDTPMIMSIATPIWLRQRLHPRLHLTGYFSGYTHGMPTAMCMTTPAATLHGYAYNNVTRLHPQTIFMVACTCQKVIVSSSFSAPAMSSLHSIFVYKT